MFVNIRLFRAERARVDSDLRNRIHDRADIASLWVIRENRAMRSLRQNAGHERRLCTFGPNLHKGPRAHLVHILNHLDILNRSGDLLREKVANLARFGWVSTARDVGQNRKSWRVDRDPLEVLSQWHARRCDHLRVERMAHRKLHHLEPEVAELLNGCARRFGEASNNGLTWAILVRTHHVTIHAFEHRLDFVHAGWNAGHDAAITVHRCGARHFGSSCCNRLEGALERHNPSRYTRTVFAQTMSGDDIGLDTHALEDFEYRDVERQNSRLSHLGLAEIAERLSGVDL